MAAILSRRTWTDTPKGFTAYPARRITPSQVVFLAAHYPAAGNRVYGPNPTLAQSCAALRGWRNLHVRTNGWADLGYPYAIDQAGRIFDGAGDTHAAAHSGSPAYPRANWEGLAVLFIVGNNEKLTPAAKAAFKRLGRHLRGKFPNLRTTPLGHQQVRGASTACPGTPIMNDLRAGELNFGGVAPVADITETVSGAGGFAVRKATTITGFAIATQDTQLRTQGRSTAKLVRTVRKGDVLLLSGLENNWWMSVGDYWVPKSAIAASPGSSERKLHHGQYPDRALPENSSDTVEAKLAREEVLMRIGAMNADQAGAGWSSLHRWLGTRGYTGSTTVRLQKFLTDLKVYDAGWSAQSQYGPQTIVGEKKWLNKQRALLTPRPVSALPALRAYRG